MIKEIRYSSFIEEAPIARPMIDEYGREVLDTTPRAVPIPQLKAPSSMAELIHALYRQMKVQDDSVETFEDANNFDVEDELGIEMSDTPYEQNFDHLEPAPETPRTPEADSPVPPEITEPVQE